jgi:predicted dehydrogenase
MHLDYTQRTYQRNFEFFGENGTLKWEFNERRVSLFTSQNGQWELFEEPSDYDFNDMYMEEMKHFLHCVHNTKQTVTDIESGLETLKLIMTAKASALEGRILAPEGNR